MSFLLWMDQWDHNDEVRAPARPALKQPAPVSINKCIPGLWSNRGEPTLAFLSRVFALATALCWSLGGTKGSDVHSVLRQGPRMSAVSAALAPSSLS
jgi:hypothetical protein